MSRGEIVLSVDGGGEGDTDEFCLEGTLLGGGTDADCRDGAAAGGRSSRVRARRGADALEPRRGAVDTHRLVIIAQAGLEHARVVVGGHVPHAAHDIVDVLAERGRAGAVFASAEAELGVGHEVCPLVHLAQLTEGTGEDETADGVAYACTITVSAQGPNRTIGRGRKRKGDTYHSHPPHADLTLRPRPRSEY